jgi:hypothetical protein
MSHNESFFDEVTEEVRRDRLFGLFRRWAWLALLVVLIVVGLAAWNEWRKARATATAQALGDAVVAALAEPDAASRAAALGTIGADAEGCAFLAQLTAAAAAEGDDDGGAAAALEADALRGDATARWRDLATLKLVLVEGGSLTPEDRIARLEPLTAAGAPYRLLALEQTAYARAEMGETEAALAVLRDILADGEVTEGLRLRAGQLIVALGGSPDPA